MIFFDLLATMGMNPHLGFLLRCVLFVLFVGYVVITFNLRLGFLLRFLVVGSSCVMLNDFVETHVVIISFDSF